MTLVQDRITPAAALAAAELLSNGWARLRPAAIWTAPPGDAVLLERERASGLFLDPSPGRRWRSHRAGQLGPDGFALHAPGAYRQGIEYNWTDGDKDRHFAPISDAVVLSETVQSLIRVNAGFAHQVRPQVFAGGVAQIGLHIISYRPENQQAAYASPIWLHRDEERYVAVHLLSLTAGLRGGDNVIEAEMGGPLEMFGLSEHFEALLLTQAVRHAVTPCYAVAPDQRRDVLLITFT